MFSEQKIMIDDSQVKFIKNFKNYGFKSPDELVNYAIEFFKKYYDIQKELEVSADLYAELYQNDDESKEWIDSSLKDWK